ncbi:hypothetical protein AB3N04_01710 [Alkalihalophilus sp. As8PL]|uniref:Uncharacterized protein n=2 Tax=Alkalihalophilus TaxID=2893060 RepID=A0AB39BTE2_9BACI|nr:hypothetical protein [Alkalihalophilus lindianensis]MDV2683544.1 hypothetical protein [Alkalihalophilus lindianensis]
MEEGLLLVIFAMVFFLLTGVFGGIGIYYALHNNKKRAIWNLVIGFICIITFIIFSFLGAMQ